MSQEAPKFEPSRLDFINKWKHELAGLVTDACCYENRGAALALFIRNCMVKIDGHLGKMYDELVSRPRPVKATIVDPNSGLLPDESTKVDNAPTKVKPVVAGKIG